MSGIKKIIAVSILVVVSSCVHQGARGPASSTVSSSAGSASSSAGSAVGIQPAALNSDPRYCEITGKPDQWESEYCLWQVGTDDLSDQQVQGCLQTLERDQSLPEHECERKVRLKAMICQVMIETGFFLGDVNGCVQSEDSVARVTDETIDEVVE
jgi:hypothetical protein